MILPWICCPFALSTRQIIINNNLTPISKISKLRFPHREHIRIRNAIAILKPQHPVLTQMTIMNETAFLVLRGQQVPADQLDSLRVVLVVDYCMAVRKSATLYVFPGKTDVVAFFEKRRESQRLRSREVDLLTISDWFLPEFEDFLHLGVQGEIGWQLHHPGKKRTQVVEVHSLSFRGVGVYLNGFYFLPFFHFPIVVNSFHGFWFLECFI